VKIRLGTRDADDILRQFAIVGVVSDKLLGFFNSPLGLDLTVEKVTPDRTRKQEKYYRKWCGEFAKHIGTSPDKMHDIILKECFGTDYIRVGKKEYAVAAKRSGDTNRESYSELIETLIRFAAFAEFIVPPPPIPEPIE